MNRHEYGSVTITFNDERPVIRRFQCGNEGVIVEFLNGFVEVTDPSSGKADVFPAHLISHMHVQPYRR